MQSCDNAGSLPMLEMPGCAESHRLPNAVAVISALISTAQVRANLLRSASARGQYEIGDATGGERTRLRSVAMAACVCTREILQIKLR